MSTEIYTPTAEQLDARIARFDQLTPMSTTDDLAWVPSEAWEIFFAQKKLDYSYVSKKKGGRKNAF